MSHPVLIGGKWRAAEASGSFQAVDPKTRATLPDQYPISTWKDLDEALTHAAQAFVALKKLGPEPIAQFLELYADKIDAKAAELVAAAHSETGLPVEPRLAKAELPRTSNQLRQAAAAAREGSWAHAVIDTKANIRSVFAGAGPVAVFGPNNFPFAFNSIAGGDFAAAIAAGCPVIAKGHSSHPTTTRLFGELAHEAANEAGLPVGTVQLVYRTNHADGEKLVSDHRLAATGYTGGRGAGLKLKAAADKAGKPFYAELSSVNPLVILPGALEERAAALVDEYSGSCLMGTGQFCTNPGCVLLIAGPATDAYISKVVEKFNATPAGTLLSGGTLDSLHKAVETLEAAGAELLTGGDPISGAAGFQYANTLLRIDGQQFLASPEAFQTEAFGNAAMFVVAADVNELEACLSHLEGNLTGAIYSHTSGADDAMYAQIEPTLRGKVGRLINDKMPTGVAVSPAMNHGGPYPATGHAGFTAVGIPASMIRFANLQCYDAVREARLPPLLRNKNPTGKTWRLVDLAWTQADVG